MNQLRRYSMKNDVLIYLEKHYNAAKKIYTAIPTETKFVAIGGISGTGKTEVADELCDLLNVRGIWAHIISLDQYYKVAPEKREQWRRDGGDISKWEIDWDSVYASMAGRVYSHFNVLIIEGLYACYLDNFNTFKVSLVTDPNEAFQFRKDRKKEDEDCEFRQHIVLKETEAVEELYEQSNLILEL